MQNRDTALLQYRTQATTTAFVVYWWSTLKHNGNGSYMYTIGDTHIEM